MSRRKKSRKKRSNARHAGGQVHHKSAGVEASRDAAVVTSAAPSHSGAPAADESADVAAPVAEAPAAEASETPAAEASETPAAEASEAPAAEASETPAAEASEAPVAEASEAPAAEASEAPVAEASEAPVAEASETPELAAAARSAGDAGGEHFSALESSFFADGDALADAPAAPADDFSDLEPRGDGGSDSWARRALDVLALVPARLRR